MEVDEVGRRGRVVCGGEGGGLFSLGTRPRLSGKQLASSAVPELYTPCGDSPFPPYTIFSRSLMYLFVCSGIP